MALGSASLCTAQVQSTMTSAGHTGLGITPNAHLLAWGRSDFTYDRQLPGNIRNTIGHNFVLGFGLLPNLEIVGRMAANDLHKNCYVTNCGARDLSASAKAGIGLDTTNRFRIAAGMTDVGGSVTYFRSYYGVLTYNEGSVEASAGLARRSGKGVNGSRSPLDGPFASAAWQPYPLVRGHVEYSDGNAWAGVRVFAPMQWLPEGWSLSAGTNVRLKQTNLTQRTWWTTSLSIPLYKVPSLPGQGSRAGLPVLGPGQLPPPLYEARALPPAAPAELAVTPSASASTRRPIEAAASTSPPDDALRAAATALQAKGLEDISVGRLPDGAIALRANNGSYQWNTADAVGAALGAVARSLGSTKSSYRLIVTQLGVPLVAVTGQTDCLRNWIEQRDGVCTASQLSTPGTGPLEPLHDGVAWVVRDQHPGWETVRIGLSPVLRTNMGTEVGVLDYSIGASISALLPLWTGGNVEWRVNVPVSNSSDYDAGGLFADRRIRSGTERLAYTHAWRLPLERWLTPSSEAEAVRMGLGALTAQATLGRVGTFFDGLHGAVRWEPGEGRHRVTAQAGAFHNNSYDAGRGPLGTLRTAGPVLASYRYSVLPTRTYLEATAGQFMNNDRGFQLGMRQWFSDVALGVYYKRTKFDSSPVRQLVGLELSVPIGPRRDANPIRHLQVTGTQRFAHAIESSVREARGNPLRIGHGVAPPVPTLDAVFNSDRASLTYFEDNILRIRDAAR